MVPHENLVHFREYQRQAGRFLINCREAGEGLPVIFLQTMGWGADDLYDALARQFHLFVLDLENVGIAEDGLESAIREVAASLAGEAYNLVGASQGANLALRTILGAPMDPEPVEALALLSPNAVRPAPDLFDLDNEGWAQRLVAHPDRLADLGGLPQYPDMGSRFLPLESDRELEARLAAVGCPTVAAFGTRDRLVAREAPSTYRANIPNCHVSLIYDAGHLAWVERPAAVAKVVADFIENRETFVVNRERSVISP